MAGGLTANKPVIASPVFSGARLTGFSSGTDTIPVWAGLRPEPPQHLAVSALPRARKLCGQRVVQLKNVIAGKADRIDFTVTHSFNPVRVKQVCEPIFDLNRQPDEGLAAGRSCQNLWITHGHSPWISAIFAGLRGYSIALLAFILDGRRQKDDWYHRQQLGEGRGMSETIGTDGGKRAIPYVSFATFETFVSDLRENGIPSRIDRSVLKRFAGGTASQLLTSLKAMGLMEENNVPTPALRRLVEAHATEMWKDEISDLTCRVFEPVTEMDLMTATPSQFAEKFRASFTGGEEVQRKGAAFFFNAAKIAGIDVGSRILANKRPNSGPRKPRSAKKAKLKEEAVTPIDLTKPKDEQEQPRRALHHELVDILSSKMSDEEKNAVWTLVLYLKGLEASEPKEK
ncbi:DUF5343 domain-containing protein [Sphingosinicella ginsenosidimutans]|uniref:DUF5343 domain-containing protein n=1 Tax=Allosphingosinicella ginsenosidimutans TaxID=1176539 RepID=UPI0011BF3417|nr:DUF5343 domain-containing protein [Sphingosinicella ginsenosidimutans]